MDGNIKDFYAIELGCSSPNEPDFLKINDDKSIQWISSSRKSNGGSSVQKAIAVHQATQFDDEVSAHNKVVEIFGKKFNYRITKHFKYT